MIGDLTPAELAELEAHALLKHEIRQCMDMARQSELFHLPHRHAYWSRRADLAALAWSAVDRALQRPSGVASVILDGDESGQ